MADNNVHLRTWHVYLADNPITRKGYIGITRLTTAVRWSHHRYAAKYGHSKALIHKAIQKHGASVFIVSTLYEAFSLEEAWRAERILIAQYGTLSPRGYNLTTGGEGGADFAPEVIAEMQRTRKGRKHPPEVVARVAALNRGRKRPQAAIDATAAKNRGRVYSAEFRDKLSKARLGKTLTPEAIEKRSAKLRGRRRSPTAIAATAAANRGRKIVGDALANIQRAARNRKAPTLHLSPIQRFLNQHQRPTTASSGWRGVRETRNHAGWEANIKAQGVAVYLGSYPSLRLAADAYRAAASKYAEALRSNALPGDIRTFLRDTTNHQKVS